MDDDEKSKSQLLQELTELRKQIDAARASEINHKHVEEDLRSSLLLLQLVLDTIPQRVFWKDRASSYLGCNKSFARDAGLVAPSDLVGKNDFELGWKNEAELYRGDDASVMENDSPKVDFNEPQTRPDGKQVWIRTIKVPLHDCKGKVIGILGTYEDITRFKEEEERAKLQRNLLRTLIDNLPDLIYFKDTKGRYILNNRTHLRSLGSERQEDVLGKSSYDFHPDELASRYYEDEMEIIRSGKPLLDREELALHRDTGKKRWHLTSKVPLVDAKGVVTGFVGISRDITAQRQAEQDREKLILELQNALADVRTLSGLVPICAKCKKIRDDKGYWTQLEAYIQDRTPAHFSHGICPECAKDLYPKYFPSQKE